LNAVANEDVVKSKLITGLSAETDTGANLGGPANSSRVASSISGTGSPPNIVVAYAPQSCQRLVRTYGCHTDRPLCELQRRQQIRRLKTRGTGDAEKDESAEIFYGFWKQAEADPRYVVLKKGWKGRYG
jgi:hypothetical protein